jgi:hypothetical protein
LLSVHQALRRYDHRGVVFHANNADGMAPALEHAVAHREQLAAEIQALRVDLEESWQQRRQELETWLSERLLRASPAASPKS